MAFLSEWRVGMCVEHGGGQRATCGLVGLKEGALVQMRAGERGTLPCERE